MAHFTRPKRTKLRARLAPKPLPVTTTVAPRRAEVGVSCSMRALTVNLTALTPVPMAVITRTRPLEARRGTVTVSRASEATLKLLAATPPKVTAVASLRPLPITVTSVPVRPAAG